MSAIHFARPTGPIPVGQLKKACNGSFQSNKPKREEWLLLLLSPLTYAQCKVTNQFVKMEHKILLGLLKVDQCQLWAVLNTARWSD